MNDPHLNPSADNDRVLISKAELDALRQSEEKYRLLFKSIDEGVTLFDVILNDKGKMVDAVYVETNPACFELTGLPKDLVGKRVSEVIPDLEQFWFDTYERVVKTGIPERFEHEVSGLDRWFDIHVSRVDGDGSRTLVTVYNNITERKLTADRQGFVINLSDALRAETGVDAIGSKATKLIAERLKADRVYLVTLNPDDDNVVITHETKREDMPPLLGSYRSSDFPSAIKELFEHTIVYDDVRTDPRLTDLECLSFTGLGAVGFIATSIKRGDKEMIWAAGALCTEPRKWTNSEISLFEDAVERTWAAIERARIEESLRLSENRLQLALSGADIFTWEVDPETGETIYSENFNSVIGFEISKVSSENFVNIYPDDEEFVLKAVDNALRGIAPLNIDHRVINPRTKEVIWIKAQGHLTKNADGKTSFIGITQNINQRKLAEETLREVENKYRANLEKEITERTQDLKKNKELLQATLDSNPEMIQVFKAVRNRKKEIVDFVWVLNNESSEKIYGDVIGKSLLQNNPGVKAMGIFDSFVQVVESGVPQRYEKHYTREQFDGWFYQSVVKMDDGVATNTVDITERVLAADSLRRSEEQLRSFVHASSNLIYNMNADWTEMHTLDGKNFMVDMAFPTENWVDTYIPEKERPRVWNAINKAIKHKSIFELEHKVLTADGTVGWAHSRAVPLLDNLGNIREWFGVASDITGKQKAEQNLQDFKDNQNQEIFRTTLKTEEEERKRISESLHNGLGQVLYGVKISLGQLTAKNAVEDPVQYKKDLQYSVDLLSEAIKDTRNISHELAPTVLEEFGLKVAIEEVCHKLSKDIHFTCNVKVTRLMAERYLQLAVYRTVQELMMNVVTHANATEASANVAVSKTEISIVVKDNGRGFTESAEKKAGIGLASIRSKVKLLNGSFKIDSSPSKGTTVTVTIPFEEKTS